MKHIVNQDVFDSSCDAIVIPISTAATISESFLNSIYGNKMEFRFKKTRYKLGDIEMSEVFNHAFIKYIFFACSVDNHKSDYNSIKTIAENIGMECEKFIKIKKIATPFLGTGAGGLNYFESEAVFFRAFFEKAPFQVNLIFCTPDIKVYTSFKNHFLAAIDGEISALRKHIINNQKEKNKELDIGNYGIKDLDIIPELFECIHLENLTLSNEWGIYYNGRWVRKQSINKGAGNVIKKLNSGIKKLKRLQIFICGGNWNTRSKKDLQNKWEITDISVLASLTNLRMLNVSNNKIGRIGEIHKLKKLEKLYLNNNEIFFFPDISSLQLLSEIYLSNNKISEIEFLEKLPSIETIDLHSNNISDITSLNQLVSKLGIIDSKWAINTISIASNPLIVPPIEVVSQGKDKVLAYFSQLEAEQTINLQPFINRDIKLILVGNSNVGKSTLLYWLKNGVVKKDVVTTHWLVPEQWKTAHNGKDYTVRVFDFGGQEYYHDTHHLFFTNKTAYILIWDGKSNCFSELEINQKQLNGDLKKVLIQSFPLGYWLDSINFHTRKRNRSSSEKEIEQLLDERDKSISELVQLGQDWTEHVHSSVRSVGELNKNANVLVVQNKVDSISDKIFLDENVFKKNYDNIFDFCSISVFEERGLLVLKENIFQILDLIPLLGEEHLGTWGYIKNTIENESFSKALSTGNFRNFCNKLIAAMPDLQNKTQAQIEKVLFSNQDAESFAQYLNDIGILLFYPENDDLKDTVFINQKIILDNIYKVLLNLDRTNGEFNLLAAAQSMSKKPSDEGVNSSISLMLQFKIIFKHPIKEDTYIAPLYLPKEPMESIKLFLPLFNKPVYRYYYQNFIYKNIILDFFHHYGKKVLRETKTDTFYYWKNGIVIKDDASNELVLVRFFFGQQAHIDLYKIEHTDGSLMNQVVQDLDKINEEWRVTKTVTTNGEDFVPLDIILKSEEEDNWIFYFNDKHFKLIDFKKHLKKPQKMKKIFISYSKQDFHLVSKFIEHLSALQLDGKVSHWYCSELAAGSVWNDEIQKHLNEADIICFMISPNFMKTKYIHEHEIAKAFEKQNKNAGFKIVPIILDYCRWNTVKNNLGQFTALPYTAKPVRDFKDQNIAWYIIEECLRLMIDQDLNPAGDNFYSNQQLPPDIQKLYTRVIAGQLDNNSL